MSDVIKINNGGNVNNVLLGSDSDVTIKFDIASATALEDSESVQGTDTLLIADGSQSNAVRKITYRMRNSDRLWCDFCEVQL